jgi:hypothetical protein
MELCKNVFKCCIALTENEQRKVADKVVMSTQMPLLKQRICVNWWASKKKKAI